MGFGLFGRRTYLVRTCSHLIIQKSLLFHLQMPANHSWAKRIHLSVSSSSSHCLHTSPSQVFPSSTSVGSGDGVLWRLSAGNFKWSTVSHEARNIRSGVGTLDRLLTIVELSEVGRARGRWGLHALHCSVSVPLSGRLFIIKVVFWRNLFSNLDLWVFFSGTLLFQTVIRTTLALFDSAGNRFALHCIAVFTCTLKVLTCLKIGSTEWRKIISSKIIWIHSERIWILSVLRVPRWHCNFVRVSYHVLLAHLSSHSFRLSYKMRVKGPLIVLLRALVCLFSFHSNSNEIFLSRAQSLLVLIC